MSHDLPAWAARGLKVFCKGHSARVQADIKKKSGVRVGSQAVHAGWSAPTGGKNDGSGTAGSEAGEVARGGQSGAHAGVSFRVPGVGGLLPDVSPEADAAGAHLHWRFHRAGGPAAHLSDSVF